MFSTQLFIQHTPDKKHIIHCLTVALFSACFATHLQAAAAPPPTLTLQQAFEAAWAQQPEARSRTLRQEADAARQESADSWTAAPPSLELSSRTDQANQRQGKREYVAGVALPLWLPGERARTSALATAETRLTEGRIQTAQLRTAEALRTAWWEWQRACSEQALAQSRLLNVRQLAEDVALRVKAGDLAPADQYQADGAQAAAEADLALATSLLAAAEQNLHVLTGLPIPTRGALSTPQTEPLPVIPAIPNTPDTPEAQASTHPALLETVGRAEVARRNVDLARVQSRENPELTLSTTHERDNYNETYQQSLTIGIRIPLGSAPRNQAKIAFAQAEAIEAEEQARLENERLTSLLKTEHIRVEAIRAQLAAADKRAHLAKETRTFFQKSFELGEIDLPNRLRIELEATEAERQAARARIELAAAISALRQALGLLPE